MNLKKKQAETPNPASAKKGDKKKGEVSPEKVERVVSDYYDDSPELHNNISESQIHIDPEMMQKMAETAQLLD